MTVSEAVIKWLKQFNSEDIMKMNQIDTDLMHGDVDYALVKEPVTTVKKFVSGTEVHSEYYQIRARFCTQTNRDCVDNGAWLEALTEWISEQNRNNVFPAIEAGTVQEVGVSSPFYMGRNEENQALYQLTIYIKYMKKGVTE